jgi:hypothetical protein
VDVDSTVVLPIRAAIIAAQRRAIEDVDATLILPPL